MKLIFAFYNVEFAKDLKGNMEASKAARIVDIVSSEEDLINAIAKDPTIDGVLISTDIATKLGNRNLELFVDVLLAARKKFSNDIVFTVLSSEKVGHPIHAELVDMAIYNIFIKGADKFTVPSLLNSFVEPLTFASAVQHKNVDGTIPWRRDLSQHQTIKIELETKTEPKVSKESLDSTEGVLAEEIPKKKKWLDLKALDKRVPTEDKEVLQDDMPEWLEDNQKIVPRVSVTGTVVIAIGSVAPHLGATHTAISIASALKKKGHLVALVEGNSSQDYDRIHSLYEGEDGSMFSEGVFSLNGIDHYKYRGEDSVQELFALYEYLVLDIGSFELNGLVNEFRRAHVRGVICSAHEWKFHWIEEFRRRHFEDKDIYYLVPHGEPTIVNDLQARLKEVQVLSVPSHADPYKPNNAATEFTENLLSDFLTGFGKQFSKRALIGTMVASVLLTIAIFTTFLLI